MSDSDSNNSTQGDKQEDKPTPVAAPAATTAAEQTDQVRETVVAPVNQLNREQTQRLARAINTGGDPGDLDEDADRVDLDASGNPAQTSAVAPNEPTPGQSAETAAMVADLEQGIRDCDNDMAEIDGQIAQLQTHRKQVEQERDALLQKKKELVPPPSQAQALQQYLAQQQRNREERHSRALAMFGGTAKAPIDAARAARPGHGAVPVQYPNVLPNKP